MKKYIVSATLLVVLLFASFASAQTPGSYSVSVSARVDPSGLVMSNKDIADSIRDVSDALAKVTFKQDKHRKVFQIVPASAPAYARIIIIERGETDGMYAIVNGTSKTSFQYLVTGVLVAEGPNGRFEHVFIGSDGTAEHVIPTWRLAARDLVNQIVAFGSDNLGKFRLMDGAQQ